MGGGGYGGSGQRDFAEINRRKRYLANLGLDTGQDELSRWLEEQGLKTKYIRIIFDQDGKTRGFGFVEFFSEEDAQKADALNGTSVYGKPIKINPVKARSTLGGGGGGGRGPPTGMGGEY